MTTVWAWARLDLRRRWRSLVVLALLIAVTGGTVMTALAGAHRGATALDRLTDLVLPSDTMVLPNDPDFDWQPFRELEYVEGMSEFVLGTTPVVEGGVEEEEVSFPRADDEFGRTLERPVVFEGRNYHSDTVDEAVMTPGFAERHDLEVGDTLVAHLASPRQANVATEPLTVDEAEGPRVEITIVGIVRTFWGLDLPGSIRGSLMLSPGLFSKYRDNIMGSEKGNSWINAQFRLENGAADLPRLRRDVERITGRSDIDVEDFSVDAAALQKTLDFEARCLLAFGFAALLAGVVLVGQAVARYAAAEAMELRTGRAVGMTPRQTIAAAAVGPFLSAMVGVVLAIVVSVAASTRFPIGTAAGIEPSPGVDVDVVIISVVGLAIIVLATAGAAMSAAISLRAEATAAPRRSPVATAVSAAGFPVPVVVGTRFALERGLGRTSVPVLPALVGAVAGVLGVVAAFSFAHAVDDAIDHPERFGQTYQAIAFGGYNGDEFLPLAEMGESLRALDYVVGVDHGRFDTATGRDGATSVDLWSYEPGEKALPTVVVDGRMPESELEVLLAPGSLDELGLEVGDTVELNGRESSREVLVVGTGFVPTGPHNSYNEGGFVTAKGYLSLFGDHFKFSVLFVAVAEPARGDDLTDQLTSHLAAALPSVDGAAPLLVRPSDEGLDVSFSAGQLKQIRVLPIALGLFLGLQALGAVGHAIATATRRRGHDLAALRAIGMTPWQSRGVVAVQATVLVLVGLAFGIVLGLAVGRSVWRLVADFMPLDYVPPTAVLALALIGPTSLVLAYLVAAWPAVRASGLRIAHVLRVE